MANPPITPPGRALELKTAQMAQAMDAIRAGEVDALFVAGGASGSNAGWMFTLDGADRAYRRLIEEITEGVLTLTPEDHIAYANRRFAELLGRPLHRVIGSPLADCFAPEGRVALAELLAAGRSSKQSAELELLADTGARTPTLLSISPLTADGLPGSVGLVVTDLTGQRRSEAEAAEREQLLVLVESLLDRLRDRLRDSLATHEKLEACVANLTDIVLIRSRRSPDAQEATSADPRPSWPQSPPGAPQHGRVKPPDSGGR